MEKTSLPFNLYDLLGCVIPGLLVLWAFENLFRFFGASFPLAFKAEPVQAGVLLLMAYFVGHITQTLSSWSRSLFFSQGRQPSEWLLDVSSKAHSEAFNQEISSAAERLWGGKLTDQERFELAYSLVIQKGLNPHTEIFNAIYGFCRAATLASWFCGVILAFPFLGGLFGIGSFSSAEQNLLLPGLFFLAGLILRFRTQHFARLFADSVYRGFYIYSKEQET